MELHEKNCRLGKKRKNLKNKKLITYDIISKLNFDVIQCSKNLPLMAHRFEEQSFTAMMFTRSKLR
tara:strand:- start:61 stop:258 length:198 start_codon:yes stop_codon:yes gene_type:complete